MTQRGALEIRDGRVDFERLSKVTSTLISDLVVHQTAAEKGIWDMASVGANGVNHSQLWVKGTYGEVWADCAAYLTLVSDMLSLSMSAKYWAPSDPSWL